MRYSMFAYADMIIYPHLASQYHAWPLVVRGTVVLRVDKFLCKRQQTEVGVGVGVGCVCVCVGGGQT